MLITQPAETITVESDTLFCDGGVASSGHPRVFLTMKDGKVDCPYCGRRFILDGSAAPHSMH